MFVSRDGDVQTLPAGKPGMQVEKRRYVMIGKDGKRMEWEGDADDNPPAWVQALPEDGAQVEKHLRVIVDKDGNRTVTEEQHDTSP